MRMTRIFVAERLQSGAEIALPSGSAHHVARVLRMQVGASLIVFDGSGGEYRAEILGIAANKVTVRIGEFTLGTQESKLHISLVQGVSRGERMDWTLQKATELGVSSIVPVLTARSVVRLDDKQAAKKQEHWRSIVISACEQSGRTAIPSVAAPVNLRDFLTGASKDCLRIVLNPTAGTSLAGMSSPPARVELLIGPEGGLDEDELTAAEQAGYTPMRLGPRVLRTETAAVVALSVLQARWGDLQ